ncbi:class I SAM-dependent methyltransferase [Nocardia ninae]|uniref:Methyltransferase type 11 domain-containing protein n=1 Tax=Nocardia ninae NBRC 108245 TaxID=1210091 RepID=A0A511MLN7_9NOCA|nr:class I SAM-dependent methyltransferase [Nocardia ninae]GEM41534.1 hypothetical protein NN4_60530 [Nocardia ninae NBRC 108245]
MTGLTLTLTTERRTELAALLEDPQRLRLEYPKVAEYLDTAPMLPGTEDAAADAAFDLRLVHYMTGGVSDSGNPYWDIVAPSVGDDNGRRVVNGGRQNGSARLAFAQTILQAVYAYAVPSPESIEWIAQFSGGQHVLELGAGRGYWAAQLATRGVDVAAFDAEPPNSTANVSFPGAAGQLDVWHAVGGLDEFDAALKGNCVLFLCWPPGWGNPMASQALAAFEARGGQRLVYIGEPKGGKTGDDAFFDRLSEHWSLETADTQHVSWWNLADVAQGWVRSAG